MGQETRHNHAGNTGAPLEFKSQEVAYSRSAGALTYVCLDACMCGQNGRISSHPIKNNYVRKSQEINQRFID